MIKGIISFRYLLLLFVVPVFFVACEEEEDDTPTPVMEDPDVVAYLQADDNYSLLVDAVVKADLVTTLQGDGPFTLFAPDNDAFQAFLDAAGTGSVEATPADVLASVLLNHVITARAESGSLTTGYVETAATPSFDSEVNLNLYIDLTDGVTLNGTVKVTEADIDVTNGVIHKVDNVIGLPTVVTFAVADPTFATLTAALTRDGLTTDFVDVLSGDGPFTVFAPTNEAFGDLLVALDVETLDDVDAATLEAALLAHVTTAGNVRSTALSNGQEIETLQGAKLTVNLDTTPPTLEGPNNTVEITVTDVQAANGVVHVINAVILP
jgi:uncharacterized surface protein with fasciclin (FAS1) repeats